LSVSYNAYNLYTSIQMEYSNKRKYVIGLISRGIIDKL